MSVCRDPVLCGIDGTTTTTNNTNHAAVGQVVIPSNYAAASCAKTTTMSSSTFEPCHQTTTTTSSTAFINDESLNELAEQLWDGDTNCVGTMAFLEPTFFENKGKQEFSLDFGKVINGVAHLSEFRVAAKNQSLDDDKLIYVLKYWFSQKLKKQWPGSAEAARRLKSQSFFFADEESDHAPPPLFTDHDYRSVVVVDCFDFTGNAIGDRGIRAFVEFLVYGNILCRSIKLHGNQIGLAGVQALCHYIAKVPVSDLHLSHNYIPETGYSLMLQAVAVNPNLPVVFDKFDAFCQKLEADDFLKGDCRETADERMSRYRDWLRERQRRCAGKPMWLRMEQNMVRLPDMLGDNRFVARALDICNARVEKLFDAVDSVYTTNRMRRSVKSNNPFQAVKSKSTKTSSIKCPANENQLLEIRSSVASMNKSRDTSLNAEGVNWFDARVKVLVLYINMQREDFASLEVPAGAQLALEEKWVPGSIVGLYPSAAAFCAAIKANPTRPPCPVEVEVPKQEPVKAPLEAERKPTTKPPPAKQQENSWYQKPALETKNAELPRKPFQQGNISGAPPRDAENKQPPLFHSISMSSATPKNGAAAVNKNNGSTSEQRPLQPTAPNKLFQQASINNINKGAPPAMSGENKAPANGNQNKSYYTNQMPVRSFEPATRNSVTNASGRGQHQEGKTSTISSLPEIEKKLSPQEEECYGGVSKLSEDEFRCALRTGLERLQKGYSTDILLWSNAEKNAIQSQLNCAVDAETRLLQVLENKQESLLKKLTPKRIASPTATLQSLESLVQGLLLPGAPFSTATLKDFLFNADVAGELPGAQFFVALMKNNCASGNWNQVLSAEHRPVFEEKVQTLGRQLDKLRDASGRYNSALAEYERTSAKKKEKDDNSMGAKQGKVSYNEKLRLQLQLPKVLSEAAEVANAKQKLSQFRQRLLSCVNAVSATLIDLEEESTEVFDALGSVFACSLAAVDALNMNAGSNINQYLQLELARGLEKQFEDARAALEDAALCFDPSNGCLYSSDLKMDDKWSKYNIFEQQSDTFEYLCQLLDFLRVLTDHFGDETNAKVLDPLQSVMYCVSLLKYKMAHFELPFSARRQHGAGGDGNNRSVGSPETVSSVESSAGGAGATRASTAGAYSARGSPPAARAAVEQNAPAQQHPDHDTERSPLQKPQSSHQNNRRPEQSVKTEEKPAGKADQENDYHSNNRSQQYNTRKATNYEKIGDDRASNVRSEQNNRNNEGATAERQRSDVIAEENSSETKRPSNGSKGDAISRIRQEMNAAAGAGRANNSSHNNAERSNNENTSNYTAGAQYNNNQHSRQGSENVNTRQRTVSYTH